MDPIEVGPPYDINACTDGSLPGQFDVNSAGAGTYQIPLTVPPGSAGMEPSLSLEYNSQLGNGQLGVGWRIGGLSAITRCPATLASDGFSDGIDYDEHDRFCLDGQRLVAVNGTYGADGTEYRTDPDSFSKIISYGSTGYGPEYFRVWTKSGEIREYGGNQDSEEGRVERI